MNNKLTLPCGHSQNEEDIFETAWFFNNGKQPFVIYSKNNDFPTKVHDPRFTDRIRLEFPSGNISILPLKWSDKGIYQCISILSSGQTHTSPKYDLEVRGQYIQYILNTSSIVFALNRS
jgi:hypothetical protein